MSICYPPGAIWPDGENVEALRADPETAAVVDRAEALAWMSLATLTADRIGTCPITVRPCARGCSPLGTWTEAPSGGYATVPIGRTSFSPHLNAQGQWVNNGCSCDGDCGCAALSAIRLPGPVGQVVEVWLDGERLAEDTYRIDGDRLVSLVADRPWPSCQDLMQDAHGPDAFSVTYYRGAAPSGLILYAAGVLASEFYKGMTDDRACRLPRNVTAITRQGVSLDMTMNMFDQGKTGIDEVDAVIQRLNPYGLKSRPVVASPDTIRRGGW